MKKLLLSFLMGASLCAAYTPLYDTKISIARLLQVSHKQQELMRGLIEKAGDDLKKLSFEEIDETLTCLTQTRAELGQCPEMHMDYHDVQKLISLVNESARRLEKLKCEAKAIIAQERSSLKKIIIPVGAGMAVTGGLLVLDLLTDFDISITGAVLCGVGTGVTVGVIMHKDEVAKLLLATGKKAGELTKTILSPQALRTALKAGAAVTGVAVVGGALYTQRHKIKRLFGLSSGKRLSELTK